MTSLLKPLVSLGKKQNQLPPLSKDNFKNPTKLKPKYFLDIKNYEVVQNINSGSYGTIKLVRHKISGEKYAAKTNIIKVKSDNNDVISREVSILMRVQHPTIIKLRGVSENDFEGNNNLTFLMDYMSNGSLSELLDKESKSLCPSNYDNTKKQIILVGIAIGMMTLHNHFVIHRDLKPENILLDDDLHPCIADFGLSKFYDPTDSLNQSMSNCGTIAYMSPEVVQSTSFNSKADVYSFGILMYEVVTGSRAYDDLRNGKLHPFTFWQKVTQGLRPVFKYPIKKGIREIIESCWSSNPDERPMFKEIFMKLSLSKSENFEGFESDFSKSSHNDYDLNYYCLDDVDTEEVISYVDDMLDGNVDYILNSNSKMNSSLNDKIIKKKDELIKKQEKNISDLKKENDELKKENDELKRQINILQTYKNAYNNEIHVRQPTAPNPNLNIRYNRSTTLLNRPQQQQQQQQKKNPPSVSNPSINVSASADIPKIHKTSVVTKTTTTTKTTVSNSSNLPESKKTIKSVSISNSKNNDNSSDSDSDFSPMQLSSDNDSNSDHEDIFKNDTKFDNSTDSSFGSDSDDDFSSENSNINSSNNSKKSVSIKSNDSSNKSSSGLFGSSDEFY